MSDTGHFWMVYCSAWPIVKSKSLGPKRNYKPNFLLANFLGAKFLFAKNLFLSIKFFDNIFFEKYFLANFFRQNFFLAIFFCWRNFSVEYFCINLSVTGGICWRMSQGHTFNIWSKLGQWQLRYSRYGQMSQGQMLHGKMSIW